MLPPPLPIIARRLLRGAGRRLKACMTSTTSSTEPGADGARLSEEGVPYRALAGEGAGVGGSSP